MFVVILDTHSTGGHRLTDRTLDVVRETDLAARVGDFMCEFVLDALIGEANSFLTVYGSNDGSEIRSRIPAVRNIICGGVEFAMTYTRRGGNIALLMPGRKRGADTVTFRHSHWPGFHGTGSILFPNPGSHVQPQGNRKAHAGPEEPPDDDLCGRLVMVDGGMFETFRIASDE